MAEIDDPIYTELTTPSATDRILGYRPAGSDPMNYMELGKLPVSTPQSTAISGACSALLAALSATATLANSTGNSTITLPTGCKFLTVYATITGTAGTRIYILDTTGATDGATIRIVSLIPATASIILQTRNATSGGALLDTITTDASGSDARVDFTFNGTAWGYAGGVYPI